MLKNGLFHFIQYFNISRKVQHSIYLKQNPFVTLQIFTVIFDQVNASLLNRKYLYKATLLSIGHSFQILGQLCSSSTAYFQKPSIFPSSTCGDLQVIHAILCSRSMSYLLTACIGIGKSYLLCSSNNQQQRSRSIPQRPNISACSYPLSNTLINI